MKNKINCKGFTLVETIVVAVIVAVLAIAAVLMYRGFVTEQKYATVNNLAEAGAAAANAYVRKTGANLLASDVDKLHLYYDSTKYKVEIDPGSRRITVTDLKESTISGSAEY